MQGSGSHIKSTLVTLAALLGAGILIVGGTVWLLLDLTSPQQGEPPVATEATNYTPFVGKHW
jgi:hypothetical protein